MKEKIDHNYTNEIICPYCGDNYIDSWEVASGEEDLGLLECYECGKSFYGTRNISISYSTQKAKYGCCAICSTDNVVLEKYVSSLGNHDYMCLNCGEKEQKRLLREYCKKLDEEETNESRR